MAKEIKTVKVVVTNISRSPRGVNTAAGGNVIVNPGKASPEIVISAGELASLRAGTEFSIEERGEGKTLIRYDAPVRRSKVNVHDDEIASLRAEIAELKKHAATKDDDAGDDRAELKKQAAELGIDFPRNIPTDKLKELIDAKLAA